jgi:uncharacterized protein YfdQ (DUF2303 family)
MASDTKNQQPQVVMTPADRAFEQAIDVGRKMSLIQRIDHDGHNPVNLVLVPEGYKSELLTVDKDPDRIRVDVDLYDLESFIMYVNEHKGPHTRIFAQTLLSPYEFAACFDYHHTNGMPEWCAHVARLKLTETDQFKTWKANNEKGFSQADFALFIEDNSLDVIEPDGATMFELALDMRAAQSTNFDKKVVLENGDTRLTFEENTDIQHKDGCITIPKSFVIEIPVFEGVPAIRFECRFVTKLKRPSLELGYQIIRMRESLRRVLQAGSTKILEETSVTIFQGTFKTKK